MDEARRDTIQQYLNGEITFAELLVWLGSTVTLKDITDYREIYQTAEPLPLFDGPVAAGA